MPSRNTIAGTSTTPPPMSVIVLGMSRKHRCDKACRASTILPSPSAPGNLPSTSCNT
jgi:hypothetical protein